MKFHVFAITLSVIAGSTAYMLPAQAETMPMAVEEAMHNHLKPYEAAAVKTAIESGKPVLLHFHKNGCPTCAAQLPTVENYLKEHADVMAYQVNFITDKPTSAAYDVTMQSTLILFDNGKEIARSTGETDPVKLMALLEKRAM